jgi:hypothetical protein
MNRIICMAFFAVGALLIGKDLAEYYSIQRTFHDTMLVPILLLGILGYFAFKPVPKVAG